MLEHTFAGTQAHTQNWTKYDMHVLVTVIDGSHRYPRGYIVNITFVYGIISNKVYCPT